MKKWIKVVCCVLPVMILTLSFVFLSAYYNGSKETKTINAAEQVANAASSTGASSAPKSEKGGAIFLEENTSYTMSGGTIQGKSKKYGGAVYISNNATFTMNGGTITGCNAKYGGAIYVAAGGHCVIKGGTITGNSAEVAPAIYVEEGGTLTTDTGSLVDDNSYEKWTKMGVVGNGLMGGTYSGTTSTVSLDYLYFGSYPQTYVGDSMNSTLESWYKGKPVAKTYTIRDKVWNAYQYTDGELYVRGQSSPYAHNSSNATYKDGTAIKSSGTTCWFKVEPIKWFVINRSGNNYELFSELVLTGNIYFNASEDDENIWETSYIRSWCNNEFYNMAFTDSEKQHIVKTTIGNNVTGGSWPNATDDTTGKATQDNIYLMSHNEVGKTPFSGGETNAGSASRICCASDFAFSNASWYNKSSTSTSFYRSGEQITTAHWLRSAGEWEGAACYVSGGNRFIDGTVSSIDCGVRPALHVVV